jgi:hypothetical protein
LKIKNGIFLLPTASIGTIKNNQAVSHNKKVLFILYINFISFICIVQSLYILPPKVLNSAIKQYLKYRYDAIESKSADALDIQLQLMNQLVSSAEDTVYGKRHNFYLIKNRNQFINQLPIVRYEDLQPYIDLMMQGQQDVLWPGSIQYFSKSSGTTKQRSKYLPISDSFLRSNLIRSSWDTTAFIYKNDENASIFHNKSLIMGGTLHPYSENKDILVGDISAIMINTIPFIGRPFYAPDFETALLSNWDEKIDRIANQCLEHNVVMFGGVPTWNIVLFNKILERTGKNHMLEVWPELKFYLHGGVNFNPYKALFKKYLPIEDFNYIEVYNASEGYFAVQDDFSKDGMRLLTDNGIYYEFIDPTLLGTSNDRLNTLTLDEVELDKNYAIIISTCSGLWRYAIGDTIKFTSLNPYRIKVTGRTEQYINAFGEEVMISNTDKALALTTEEFGIHVNEYTVAPIFLDDANKGYHQWLIEFNHLPQDLNEFSIKLDDNLRNLNSDYDAKRYKDMALQNLKINIAPQGTFLGWLKRKNKVGGQYKIPRLQNDSNIYNEILSTQSSSNV